MSFTENDRKVQSGFGKTFPGGDGNPSLSFAQAIAAALNSEFGGSPAAVKTVSRLTLANERAVRNWFEGKNGPNGDNLVRLIYQSNAVLGTVLSLAGRRDLVVAVALADLRKTLVATIAAIDGLQVSHPA